jgi:hypothetical protein
VTVIATGFEEPAVEDIGQGYTAHGRRLAAFASEGQPADTPAYEVREKFNEEAYSRWQAFSKGARSGSGDTEKGLDERVLEVPAFFRRRPWRR